MAASRTLPPFENLLADAWATFQDVISHPTWDLGNYMILVPKVMEIAGSYKGLSGPDKKNLVMKTVGRYVGESADPILKAILSDTTVSNLIETVVSAAKGLFSLSAEEKRELKRCLLPCLTTSQKK